MSPHRVDEPLRWSSVSRTVVDQVQAVLGFEWVAVTRKRDDQMVLLQVHDDGYDLPAGDVSLWADSFCARAFDGRGPRITPDVSREPAYVELVARLGVDVAAHVSVPLRGDDGVVLGSLCGFSRSTRSPDLHLQVPMLEAFAGVLGALLAAELRLQPQVRRAERLQPGGAGDQLTGLGNRQDWERRLAAEERRCAAYGLDAGLLAVEVCGLRGLNEAAGHGAGDARLREVAAVLREVAGEDSVLARVGGDQFAVLLPDADLSRLSAVEDDLRRALRARAVDAVVGAAARGRTGAGGAWHCAVERLRTDPFLPADDEQRHAPEAARAQDGVPTSPDADLLVRELLALARRQLGAAIAFVGRWEGELRVMRGIDSAVPLPIGPGSVERLDATYCQRIVDGRLPRVIPDTGRYPAAVELPVTAAAGIGSYVGVPVIMADGSLYGTLCCLSPAPDPSLSERDADFLVAVAASMSRVLEAELEARTAHATLVARLDPLVSGQRTSIVFQPVVSLHDGRVVGSEALARFTGDQRPVDEWFRDAELAGLSCELELATARAALAGGRELPGFLAVNLSATTLCSPGFAGLMRDVDPAGLVVEISEHEQIADYTSVLAVLAPLRARGLRLAVDDAGAGFASLRHVVQLAPDIIKLDISLVRGIDTDPTRQALASALTTFAQQTGAQVVAEGVETEQQRAVLVLAGVTLMQGWLTSGGVSPAEFTARWGARRAPARGPAPARSALPAPRPEIGNVARCS